MSEFYNNSIFWVEVDRISPNPYQPRKEFNDEKIAELADSIRQYGILQPLVVTRQETEREDGGITVEYELIAGERRLRASKLAMLPQVPVIIRAQEETSKMKLELAIIENLQREDLNAIDRALAFKQLVDEFNLKHIEIAKKVGKSREYVSNTLRLLGLPSNIQNALVAREITEGHARPLLMLGERPQERDTLFTEIKTKKLTVRESERIARRIATDKARKQDLSPELITIEKNLTETLGTRVQIEQRSKKGGKVHIDYFSEEDLKRLLDILAQERGAAKVGQKSPAMPTVAAVAPEAIKTASDAIDRFNDTFKAPVPAQTAPTSTIDPFKQFELPKVQESVPKPAPTVVKDPFADLPPIPAVPTPQASVKPSDPFADLPPLPPLPPLPDMSAVVEAPFNPFAQVPAPTQLPPVPAVPNIPTNPFTDLPPLPEIRPTSAPAPTTEEPAQAPSTPADPFAIPATPAPQATVSTPAPTATNTPKYDDDDLYSIKNFSI